jgi:hypothetical protein
MVHQELLFGGTWDALGWVSGELVVLDWKTGNATYPEHVVQNAAYRELIRANAATLNLPPGTPLPESGVLIRLDKETGDPHARTFNAECLDFAWSVFAAELKLYRDAQALEKMVQEIEGEAA